MCQQSVHLSITFLTFSSSSTEEIQIAQYLGSILYRSLSVFDFSVCSCFVRSYTMDSRLVVYFSIMVSMLSMTLIDLQNTHTTKHLQKILTSKEICWETLMVDHGIFVFTRRLGFSCLACILFNPFTPDSAKSKT